MAVTAKLFEDALGADENPWATDTNSNSITVDQTTGAAVVQVVGSSDAVTCTNATNSSRYKAFQTTQSTFANGVIRADFNLTDSGSQNNKATILLRITGTGSNGLECGFGPAGDGSQYIDPRNYNGSGAGNVAKAITSNTWYVGVMYANSTNVKALQYLASAFPPGSDYKTITWDWDTTSATYTTSAGHAGIGGTRFQTAQPTQSFRNVVAYAAGSTGTAPTLSLTPGDAQVTVNWSAPSTFEQLAAAWYFIRYKAGSQPTDENDGTLVTGTGTGLSGSATPRSDGRFRDMSSGQTVTTLVNGTTYYFRPFIVMWDGTIVAGTAASTTTTGGQTIVADADNVVGGWTTAPLFSKVNDSSDATFISATAA